MPKIYVNIIDPLQVNKIEVVNIFSRPSDVCRSRNAQVAWNGANWDKATNQPDTNAYALMIFPDKTVRIGNKNTTGNWLYSTSIVRPLIENGVIVVPQTSNDPTYYEVHARSGMFTSQDGKIIHVTVDGDYVYEGVTLWKLASIGLEFGAWNGGDQGGGGDSVEVLDGIVQNIPDDELDGVHFERTVPQTVLVYAGGSMATVGTTKGVAIAKTNIKTYGGVLKVSIGVGETINDYVYGTLNSARTDLMEFDHYYKKTGERVELGEICKCVVQNMTITTETEPTEPTDPPPPASQRLNLSLDLADDGTVTGTWSDV